MLKDVFSGIEKIGNESLVNMDKLRENFPDKFNSSGSMDWKWFENDIRPNYFVYLREAKNSISFTIQNGPIKEVGKNGCQVDALLETAKLILESFNQKFPCEENAVAIQKTTEALEALEKRTRNREERGVEGTSTL